MPPADASKESPEKQERKANSPAGPPEKDGEPVRGDEYFLPAKLYPSEKPGSTPYGRGWIANVLKLFGRRGTRIVQFKVKGEDPVEEVAPQEGGDDEGGDEDDSDDEGGGCVLM